MRNLIYPGKLDFKTLIFLPICMKISKIIDIKQHQTNEIENLKVRHLLSYLIKCWNYSLID